MLVIKQTITCVILLAAVQTASAGPLRESSSTPVLAHPELVTIEVQKPASATRFCPGVLVASNAVLSAAHCVQDGYQPVRVTAASGARPSAAAAQQAAQLRAISEKATEQAIKVLSFTTMGAETAGSPVAASGRELTMIILDGHFQSPVMPVAIPNLNGIEGARQVRFLGFGEGPVYGHQLDTYADLDVVSVGCPTTGQALKSGCSEGAELYVQPPGETMGGCGGGGGPAFVRNSGGEYRLVGIATQASANGQPCQGATVVTLLDGKRLEWIKTLATIQFSPQPLRPYLALPRAYRLDGTPGSPVRLSPQTTEYQVVKSNF
jgi:hypothetical protein